LKETTQETYYGIAIFRFYIKCLECHNTITIKTDPKNSDYECESGAKRGRQAWKNAEPELEENEKSKKIKREASHLTMEEIEKRMVQQHKEMAKLEALEELKDIKKQQEALSRQNPEKVFTALQDRRQAPSKDLLSEEDERMISELFRHKRERRLHDVDETAEDMS